MTVEKVQKDGCWCAWFNGAKCEYKPFVLEALAAGEMSAMPDPGPFPA